MIKIDGKKLKELREKKGDSQEMLAQQLGYKRQSISQIEEGKTKRIHEDQFLALQKYFQVPPEKLQSEDESAEEQEVTYDEQKAIEGFIDRIYNDKMNEMDTKCLSIIAEYLGVHGEAFKEIAEKNNLHLKIYEKKETTQQEKEQQEKVWRSPLVYDSYYDRVASKIKQLPKTKLPAMERIISLVMDGDLDKLDQLEKHGAIVYSKNPMVQKSTSLNEYICREIVEHNIPKFLNDAGTEISKYSFDKNEKELCPIINNDLGTLRHRTIKGLKKLLEKWNS